MLLQPVPEKLVRHRNLGRLPIGRHVLSQEAPGRSDLSEKSMLIQQFHRYFSPRSAVSPGSITCGGRWPELGLSISIANWHVPSRQLAVHPH